MGYGSRALDLLQQYFSGSLSDLSEPQAQNLNQGAFERGEMGAGEEEAGSEGLLNERLKPR